MKSMGLTATPRGVVRRTRPEPALIGTVVLMVVELGAPMMTAVWLANRNRLSDGTGSKLAPLTATAVAAVPMAGVRDVMTGPSAKAVTTNGTLLLTDAAPTCTLIAPLVAPVGT